MWKKTIGFILSLAMLLILMTGVYAAENNPQKVVTGFSHFIEKDIRIAPLFVYTQSTYTNLSIDSDEALCYASLTGYEGVTTRIDITIYLQKRVLFFWTTDTSWSDTFYDYEASMYQLHLVSSGTYRVKAVYVAYSGSNSETITEYSPTVTY